MRLSGDRHCDESHRASLLDVAIGLSCAYLILSLLAAAVQERIAAILAPRSRSLEDGLRSMLAEDDKLLAGTSVPPAATGAIPRNLLEDFYAHPLIRSLYKTGRVPFNPKKSVDAQGQKTLGPWQNG
jgi:hypothetical protein